MSASDEKTLKEKILKNLKNVIDPDFNRDIVSLGFVKEVTISEKKVFLTINLTSPACPIKDQFEEEIRHHTLQVKEIQAQQIKEVEIKFTSQNNFFQKEDTGLKKVKNIIAISSCKGGVGKSTITSDIACQIAERGFKVGILDVDIYGPSIPTLFQCPNEKVAMKNNFLIPVQKEIYSVHQKKNFTIKIMSFAFLLGNSPAIMRGPMISNYIKQFLFQIDWGELDYLLIDMPPGTGDIQLSICQLIQLSAALIVTTRQSLSLEDTSRGILMFHSVEVPIVGVVENMVYFQCSKCDEKHYLFGEQQDLLKKKFGLTTIGQMPFRHQNNFSHYEGQKASIEMVDCLIQNYGKLISNSIPKSEIKYNDKNVTIKLQQQQITIKNELLRMACECSLCVDEYSGKVQIKKESIPKNIAVEKVSLMGHYAFSINWNDGHNSIYPFERIKKNFG